ncbi:hypothetical protein [Bradyrhizobium australafricanum]|uniref:hypothetical protein n=1 Tax=Bradyrhizobium australafricanum TaxID=2821406 RepID=UPI001CE26C35|nr:hypothetical protein [Bradyrhizobium australafricanum]MCA6099179.1 hypothetical protein [Bradyrhizobium australafricanum]
MAKGTLLGIGIGAVAVSFFAGYFAAAPLRGGLIIALQPILTTPSSAAALIAALVALIVGLVSPIITYKMGSKQAAIAKTAADAAMMTAKQAGTRALANVRLEWLKSLRDSLSEYHSILMSWEDDDPAKTDADYRRLSYLGTQLDLLLNQRKKYQQALWQVSDDILKLDTQNERQAQDERLVTAAREVLDFHWRKIKAEIVGSKPLQEPPYERPTQSADAGH